MQLIEILKCFENEVSVEPITLEQYKRSYAKLSEFLKRSVDTSDLTINNVNAYLKWLETDCKLGPVSVRNYRAGILRIWNYCVYPLAICDQYIARRIRLPAIAEKPVNAWKIDQVGTLLDAAKNIAGRLKNGVPANVLLTAWIWLGFETGLRPSDIRSLEWSQINWDTRQIILTQKKTKKIHVSYFGDGSLNALRTLSKYNQQLVFPVGKSGMGRWEKLLYKRAAQIGFMRRHREGIGTLRKSFATQVYSQFGLAASAESLGHRSGTKIAQKHYIDSSHQGASTPMRASDLLAELLRNPPMERRKQA